MKKSPHTLVVASNRLGSQCYFLAYLPITAMEEEDRADSRVALGTSFSGSIYGP
jgi:hypothetical protein